MAEALRLLLVDDDLDTRALMEGVLGREGIQVTCAASAEEALDLLAAEPCDLVLTDVKLGQAGAPGLTDGLALAREVWKRWPDLPMAMLSGYRGDHLRALQGERRLLAYFEKPVYDLRGLANTLKSAFQRYRGASPNGSPLG